MEKISIAILGIIFSTQATAATFNYATPQGQTEGSSLPVSVSAAIDLVNSTTLIVTLTNLLSDPTADNQALDSFVFSVTGNLGITSITSSAKTLTISSNGTYSVSAVASSSGWNTGWSNGSTTTIGLCDINNTGCFGAGANWPKDILVGGPNTTTNLYGHANGSLSSKSHTPLLFETVTFTVNGTNLPSYTLLPSTVSNVTFGFGTAIGELATGVETSVVPDVPEAPEPSTGMLWISGLGLIVMGALRRRGKNI